MVLMSFIKSILEAIPDALKNNDVYNHSPSLNMSHFNQNMNPYDAEYFSKMDKYFEDFEEIISLIPQNARDILELGCGTGRLSFQILQKGLDTLVVSVDISSAALSKAKDLTKSLDLVCVDILHLPLRLKLFDCVIMREVIEHFPRKSQISLLESVSSLLRSNGVLILTTPNLWDYTRLLFRSRWYGFSDGTHIGLLNPLTLKSLLRSAGFANLLFFTLHPPPPLLGHFKHIKRVLRSVPLLSWFGNWCIVRANK